MKSTLNILRPVRFWFLRLREMGQSSRRSQCPLNKLPCLASFPPLLGLFVQIHHGGQSDDANDDVHRFLHKYRLLGVTLQSCWMMRFGGGAGTEDGGGLVGEVSPVHLMGGGATILGGGDWTIGAIFGGGGKTYAWARTTAEMHSRIAAIAKRIKVLLFCDCRTDRYCMRYWIRAVS